MQNIRTMKTNKYETYTYNIQFGRANNQQKEVRFYNRCFARTSIL